MRIDTLKDNPRLMLLRSGFTPRLHVRGDSLHLMAQGVNRCCEEYERGRSDLLNALLCHG